MGYFQPDLRDTLDFAGTGRRADISARIVSGIGALLKSWACSVSFTPASRGAIVQTVGQALFLKGSMPPRPASNVAMILNLGSSSPLPFLGASCRLAGPSPPRRPRLDRPRRYPRWPPVIAMQIVRNEKAGP